MIIELTNREKNELIEELEKKYQELKDAAADFLDNFDTSDAELPTHLYNYWNDLYELSKD